MEPPQRQRLRQLGSHVAPQPQPQPQPAAGVLKWVRGLLGGGAADEKKGYVEPEFPGPPALLDWLALTHEEPMEPLLPIVDPHHHLWPQKIRPGGGMNEATHLSFGQSRRPGDRLY